MEGKIKKKKALTRWPYQVQNKLSKRAIDKKVAVMLKAIEKEKKDGSP